ncbi:MAG: class I mannose-6-phosphate isomerase [Lachnospiraceae bacterium]|nr:class I mannose-6-phosphate isomerase [Lachnospiraceae bacterium]
MSLLKLQPAFKDYIWGGYRLADEYGKADKGTFLAETWELSCYPDSPSIIRNGSYANRTLNEYIEENGKQVLGKNCEVFENFPILIKLIDARDALSIQVHPDNGYAGAHGGRSGKTEMWYILDAAEDSFIYYGFRDRISRDEFRKRIEENTLTEVLNKVRVHSGDVFFIEAGTLHSIGKGILTAEIQQNSDLTYRIYDYGRMGADGKPRELHIDDALEVTRLEKAVNHKHELPRLGSCEYFIVDRLDTDEKIEFTVDSGSFVHILFLTGEGKIASGDCELGFKKGDSFFIPADSGKVVITGKCEAIKTFEPDRV